MEALIIVPTALIIFLYIRFFFKRLRLLRYLKKAAKQAGSKLTLTSSMFWLPTNRCRRSEILVECPDAIYSVKVLGLFQRYCDLHFWNAKEYATRKYLLRFEIEQASPLGAKGGRRKHLNVDFESHLPATVKGKPIIRFFVLSPANSPIRISKHDGNTIVDLEPAGKVDNVIFADREYLYQYILLSLHTRNAKKH